MTKIALIADYQLVSDGEMPDFKPDGRLRNEEKKQENVEEKKKAWLAANCHEHFRMAYTTDGLTVEVHQGKFDKRLKRRLKNMFDAKDPLQILGAASAKAKTYLEEKYLSKNKQHTATIYEVQNVDDDLVSATIRLFCLT